MSDPSVDPKLATSVDVHSTASQSNNSVSCSRMPKNRATYWSQIIVVYAVIAAAIVHLSIQSPDKELWLILLSSSLGYILPSPGLKFSKKRLNLGFDEVDAKGR